MRTDTPHLAGPVNSPVNFLDHLSVGLIVFTPAGRFLHGNAPAVRLMGETARNTHGIRDTHNINFSPAWQAVKTALPCLMGLSGNEMTLCWMDRSKRYQEVSAMALTLDAGPQRRLLMLKSLANSEKILSSELDPREAKVLQLFAECCCTLDESENRQTDNYASWEKIHRLHKQRLASVG